MELRLQPNYMTSVSLNQHSLVSSYHKGKNVGAGKAQERSSSPTDEKLRPREVQQLVQGQIPG